MRKWLVASVLFASAAQADDAAPETSIWTSGKLTDAARLVRPAFVTGTAVVPELERQRLTEAPAAGLKVDNDVELGGQTQITPVADAHYRVHMGQGAYPNWFILRVTKVPPGGKTVRFDLDNGNVHKLITANPVFTPLRDLADTETYLPADGSDRRTAVATGGAAYPTAAGLAWKFIPDVWRSSTTDISFVQRFERDCVVALRVPYGLGYHAAFVKSLDGLPGVTVHTVGDIDGANVIEIGAADEAKRRTNPCVVVYTREDGCQQDASWLIEGAAQFLIGDTPEAVAAREKCTFMLIPIIDPAAAREAKWTDNLMDFDVSSANPLVAAYRGFAQQLSGEGRTVTAVFDFFTPESAEYRTMHFDHVNGNPTDDAAMYAKLQAACEKSGIYTCVGPVGGKSTSFSYRFIGELKRQFGARQFCAFINSQDRERHLSLDELRQLGGLFARVAADYFAPPAAEAQGGTQHTDGGH